MKLNVKQLSLPFLYGLLQILAFWIKGPILWFEVVFLVLGAVIGVVILLVDKYFLYEYYLEPQDKNQGLATRSIIFMLTLIPLAIFIITSTGSRVGTGVILGIMSGLAQEMWQMRNNRELFHQTFLFQLKKQLTEDETKKLVSVVVIAVAVWSLQIFI